MTQYVRPVVRLELGARGEHWPAEEATTQSYAAAALPELFKDPDSRVKVLGAERTFWEKVTILHATHHQPLDKPLQPRLSRHYYDLVKLHRAGIGASAPANLSLLTSVADHKSIFFRSGHARYEEARAGKLRVVPRPERLTELQSDYRKMGEMIFGIPPSMEKLLDVLREIEGLINR